MADLDMDFSDGDSRTGTHQQKRACLEGRTASLAFALAAGLLDDFMPGFRSDIMGSVDKAMDQSFSKIAVKMADTLGQYDTGVQSQFADH